MPSSPLPVDRREFCAAAACFGLAMLDQLTLAPAPAAPQPKLPPLSQQERTELRTALAPIKTDMIRYFLENRVPAAGGLVLDRVSNRPASGRAASTNPGVASAAATGYGLAALVLACEEGLLSKREAASQALAVMRVMRNFNRGQRGWLYHFLDGSTGKPALNSEISSIDSAIFYLGALAAGQYFGGGVKDRSLRMFRRVDFPMMLAENGVTLRHGFKLHGGKPEFLKARWDSFSEGIMLYMLGLGSDTHPLPLESWERGWRSDKPLRTCLSLPLFAYYYPLGFLPLQGKTDRQGEDYWEHAKRAVLRQIDFCRDHGYPQGLFGLTACDGPAKEGGSVYREYYPGHPHPEKTVAPLAMLACLPLAEREAYEAFIKLDRLGVLRHRYGPAAAFDAGGDWVAPETLGIDVGSTLLMLDARERCVIYSTMRKCEVTARALERAGFSY